MGFPVALPDPLTPASRGLFGLAGLATTGISGDLTLTKSGTTARTATFPDYDIEVQPTAEVVSSSWQARNHATYTAIATGTATDPSTPAAGHEFTTLVRNGTITIGGTAYSSAGLLVRRVWHSGAWTNYQYPHLDGAWTWTAAQTISNATAATNTTTGAVVVTGGLGIGGAAYFGGNVNLVGSTPTLSLSTGSNVTASIQLSTVSVQRCRLDADSTSTRINVAATDRIVFPIATSAVQVPVSMLVGTTGSVTAAPLTVSPSAWPTAMPTAGQVGFYLGLTSEATASYRMIGAGYCSGATNLPCAFGYLQTSSSGNTTGKFIVATRSGTGDTAPIVNFSVEPTGSIILGSSALATSATDGFLYVATCAGAPSGVPTAATGRVAVVYDTTNNQLCVYNGAWKKVTLA